ncbi:hypothetical protein [Streptomyces sp. NPDC060194]|uniref:hypothetical protein n=1 Tax=Streptomyces sp. NPDC060194 TaxID=3347069 RepID=UPI00365E0763
MTASSSVAAGARAAINAEWSGNPPYEMASQAVAALIREGRLVGAGQALELARLEALVADLAALLPTAPPPAVMGGEGPRLRAEWAVWEQVAAVLRVPMPKAVPVREPRRVHSVRSLRELMARQAGEPE